MAGPVTSPTVFRQVALAAGRDLDATLAFWRNVLGLETYARFDPPGIAFIVIGGVRLFFTDGTPQATVYLDMTGIDAFCKNAAASGIPISSPPTLVHIDTAGEFGPAGESEWMAFLKDPAGNTIGLVERRPA
ncbi:MULTISPECIES: VOC family protein [unclassified Mesorhizobium]|uniref:VOC family protein n=1 Tax=unclassified Mesorhizobium TaxID=325217 RepID=UPI00301464A4